MSHIIKKAKIERLNLPIGEANMITIPPGIVYSHDDTETYGEVSCADPFILRISREYHLNTKTNGPYRGVLRKPLQKGEEGFKSFSEIAEILEQVFGESVPHGYDDYGNALHKGLCAKIPLANLGLSSYHMYPSLCVNPKQEEYYNKETTPKLMSLFHTIGLRRIDEKGFLLGKIIKEHERLERAEESIDNVNKRRKIKRNLTDYINCFVDVCKYQSLSKGIFVEYVSEELQDVFDFFEYVLIGDNIPDLPNVNPARQTQKPEEKLI
tara:strand:- start:3787 stop:4587 length:801 start_codon:yes stop_codon:yes gene_type:complete